MFFTRESDGGRKLWENPTRLDKAEDCSIQKYLETPSKYGILVQFETRTREIIAIFPKYGTYPVKPDGDWELRSKEKGKKSIHFNGSDKNIELLLRMAISANQLNIYGAVADLCNELSEDFRALGKPD